MIHLGPVIFTLIGLNSMSLDFTKMTLEEMNAAKLQLEKLVAEKQAEGKREGIQQIHAIMSTYGLTVDDLTRTTGKSRQGQTVAPKYRDPATGATWTGRGKAPKWIDGKDRAQFAIA